MKKGYKSALALGSTTALASAVLGLAGTVPLGVALCGFVIAVAACGNAAAALWTLWQAESIRRAEAEKAEWKRDFFRNCR